MIVDGPGRGLFLDLISRNSYAGQLHTDANPKNNPIKSSYVCCFCENAGAETLSMNSATPSLAVANVSLNSGCGPAIAGKAAVYFGLNSANAVENIAVSYPDCDPPAIAVHYTNTYHDLSLDHIRRIARNEKMGDGARDPGVILESHQGTHQFQHNYFGGLSEEDIISNGFIQDVRYFPTNVHPWSQAHVEWQPTLKTPAVLPSADKIAGIILRYWTTDETDLVRLDKVLMGESP